MVIFIQDVKYVEQVIIIMKKKDMLKNALKKVIVIMKNVKNVIIIALLHLPKKHLMEN